MIDLTGLDFGLLQVIERGRIKNGPRTAAGWRCRCYCGGEITARSNDLKTYHTKSCGCVKRGLVCILPLFDGKRGKPATAIWNLWK